MEEFTFMDCTHLRVAFYSYEYAILFIIIFPSLRGVDMQKKLSKFLLNDCPQRYQLMDGVHSVVLHSLQSIHLYLTARISRELICLGMNIAKRKSETLSCHHEEPYFLKAFR